MKTAIALILITAGLNAAAQTVENCEDAYVGLTSLVHPIAENTRSFYNGDVQVMKIDQIEPACCAYGVAITLPDNRAELAGEKLCKVVKGLPGVDVKNVQASYDPAKGLLLTFATSFYDPNYGSRPGGEPLRLRINLQNSTVKPE